MCGVMTNKGIQTLAEKLVVPERSFFQLTVIIAFIVFQICPAAPALSSVEPAMKDNRPNLEQLTATLV